MLKFPIEVMIRDKRFVESPDFHFPGMGCSSFAEVSACTRMYPADISNNLKVTHNPFSSALSAEHEHSSSGLSQPRILSPKSNGNYALRTP
jgi:hypothetical protein